MTKPKRGFHIVEISFAFQTSNQEQQCTSWKNRSMKLTCSRLCWSEAAPTSRGVSLWAEKAVRPAHCTSHTYVDQLVYFQLRSKNWFRVSSGALFSIQAPWICLPTMCIILTAPAGSEWCCPNLPGWVLSPVRGSSCPEPASGAWVLPPTPCMGPAHASPTPTQGQRQTYPGEVLPPPQVDLPGWCNYHPLGCVLAFYGGY